MRWIVERCLQARVFVVVIAGAMMFIGGAELRHMPVDTLPEYAPPTVEVRTEALGLSAAEVEALVTTPLEQYFLNGAPWLHQISSKSVPGLSSVELIFEPGTDPFRARQVVQERLSEAARGVLPVVSKPPQMLQPLSSTNRVMMIGLSSSELSPIEMSVLTRWTIKPRLMGVPGVANVAVWGMRDRQLQVQVDPERLRDLGVSLDQVIETTGNALWVSPLSFLEASAPSAGGFIDTPNQRLGIQHVLPISSPAELAKVPVGGCTGGFPTVSRHSDSNCPPPPEARPLLRLGDVAQVVEDHQPLIGDAVINDGPGLLLVVEKFPEANTLEVSRGVEDAIDTLRPGLAGLKFDTTIFRPATSIERGLDDLMLAALVGLVLVALVLGLLFFQWRTALIALAAIPLSLVAAAVVLHLRGETFNVMILAGLVAALGVLIDDVVTDVENIVGSLHQRREEGSGKSIAAIVIEASLGVRSALTYATLIVVVAFVPVFFLDGLPDKFFPPLAVSYLFAVLASMVVALIVTPALSLILLSIAPPARGQPPAGRWLERSHRAVLSRVFNIPLPVLLAALGALALIGVAVVPLLSQPSLLPSFRERDLLIHLDGEPGTSQPEMVRMATEVSRQLRSIPGVRNVGAHVGRAVMSDQVVGINSGELWVSFDSEAHDDAVAALQGVLDNYPGLAARVVGYSDERVNEVLKGADQDIIVRIYGADLAVLRAKAEDVKGLLSGIDGVVEGRVDLPPEEPTVEVQVNLAAAESNGIIPGDVRRGATTLLSGIEVGSIFDQQKVFEVMVVGTPETRHSLTSIRELLLDKPRGGHLRLADVADVRIAPNPNVIDREAVSRRLDVVAKVRGRDVGSARRDVERALQRLELPLEYHAKLLNPEGQTPRERLLIFAVAAGLGILLLLQAAFWSWRLAGLAFLTLPIALVGGALAALAAGGDVTIGSYAGFFAVLGIAARNGIVLINRYRQLEREEGEPFGPGLVLRGTRERVTPILMTALATGLALAPLVLVGDVFGREIIGPMAVVILGGLVTSTLVNLFILPVLYLRFAPRLEADTSPWQLSIDPVRADQSWEEGNATQS